VGGQHDDRGYKDPEKRYGCGTYIIKCPIEGEIIPKLVRPKEHIALLEIAHLQV